MNKKERTEVVLQELKKLYPKKQIFLESKNDWQFLIAVILSARTTDKKVNEVTKELFKKYKNIKDYLPLKDEELRKEISQIGLNKGKAKNILQTAHILHEQFNEKIPDTFEGLLFLPGVGRKTANVILSHLYGKEEGIIVDTHVIRLSQKFGLTNKKNADGIEKDLLPLIPIGKRHYFSNALIAYGREYSPARSKKKDDPISLVLKKYEKN